MCIYIYIYIQYLDPVGLYLFLASAPPTQNKGHLGSRYIIGDSKSIIQKNTKNCQVYLLKYFPLFCLIFLNFQGEVHVIQVDVFFGLSSDAYSTVRSCGGNRVLGNFVFWAKYTPWQPTTIQKRWFLFLLSDDTVNPSLKMVVPVRNGGWTCNEEYTPPKTNMSREKRQFQ